MSVKILVIEDDEVVNQLIRSHLQQLGYQVSTSFDGIAGLELMQEQVFDLVLLDIMLPEIDGFKVLEKIRAKTDTPVLILSALGGEQDRIQGFRTGADDYLCKPFNLAELELRIEAILRRTVMARDYSYEPSQKCCASYSVELAGEYFAFTLTESLLLKALKANAGVTLSKAFLYQNILHKEFSRYDRTLDMHISKVRKKLQEYGLDKQIIQTVYGKGYRYCESAQPFSVA